MVTPQKPNKKPLAALVGTAAAALIAVMIPQLEGSRLTSYRDVVGVWTNCAGNTHNVQAGVTLTKEQCLQIDSDNAANYAGEADKCVPLLPLPPGQRVAVVLFTINEGATNFCKSTFARKLKAKDPTACLELIKNGQWAKADGKYFQGLQNRRMIEYNICNKVDL